MKFFTRSDCYHSGATSASQAQGARMPHEALASRRHTLQYSKVAKKINKNKNFATPRFSLLSPIESRSPLILVLSDTASKNASFPLCARFPNPLLKLVNSTSMDGSTNGQTEQNIFRSDLPPGGHNWPYVYQYNKGSVFDRHFKCSKDFRDLFERYLQYRKKFYHIRHALLSKLEKLLFSKAFSGFFFGSLLDR